MICAYCGKNINKYNLNSLFIEDDILCSECRNALKLKKRYFNLGDLKVETAFYEYDGMFRNLLIQYKECFDEALAPVFLYMLKDYIKYKYYGYNIVLMPSSRQKLEARGFNHLRLIFEPVGLKIIDGLEMRSELIQEGKNYEDRALMVNNYIYKGEHINKLLIVDDVVTSGSSMIGAYRAYQGKTKKIRAISLSSKNK